MSRENISNDRIIQWYTLKMAMFIGFKSFNLPYRISDAHTGKDPIITTSLHLHLMLGRAASFTKQWNSRVALNTTTYTILTLNMFGFITLWTVLAYFHLSEASHPASTESFPKYITQSKCVPYRSQCLDSNTGVHPHQPRGQQSEAPILCLLVSESEVITVP